MIERLVAIMARLRDPTSGCAWDRAQDFASIAPYTIEEAYEVADACERGDMADLKDELGDLLLQVVFHSRMAEEAGAFALPDVIAAIGDKMERRHPHIFGDLAEGGHHLWEQIKADERKAKGGDGARAVSALEGVAIGLPALLRAEKLGKRAARTGFDWPDPSGARAKIDEELAEVAGAVTAAERVEEIGDLLFAVVNWSRHLGVDPEAALRSANAKFERRFRAMEAAAGDEFAAFDLDAKEALWAGAKASERCPENPTSDATAFSTAALVRQGFSGWLPFPSLRAAPDCPTTGGIYVVTYSGPEPGMYPEASVGGWFKGRNPSVSRDVLAANWVPGAEIVYIGKADHLRRRLTQFADFGAGKAVGHWGGRLIWQLPDTAALRVAWLETPGHDPRSVEIDMIERFRAAHGKPPFANEPQRLGK